MPKKKKKQKKEEENKGGPRLWPFLVGTVIALIPQYLIRSHRSIWLFFYKIFRTYPGDLWYCWSHYLNKGFPYPREYPSGIQVLFKMIYALKQKAPQWLNYSNYMIIMCVLLGAFAVVTTYLLYIMVKDTHKDFKRIWIFWILAPSFLYYGFINVDFIPILTIILAYYLFKVEKEYYLAAAFLAVGTAIKVYPIFFTPLFFFDCPKKYRWGSVGSFIVIWFAFNAPFLLGGQQAREAWLYPYQWQITENFAKKMTDGSLWWIPYKLLENVEGPYKYWVGKLSLLLYGGLYFWFLKKRRRLSFPTKAAGIVILFLFTDRIYSPQYNLYLLPFLVLSDVKIDLRSFYALEIPNAAHVFFLFFFKDYPKFMPGLWLQFLVVIKYVMLIWIFLQIWKSGDEKEREKEEQPADDREPIAEPG